MAAVSVKRSIREGRVALSMGHPRGTHSRYVIGCCLPPLGSVVLKITRDEGVCGGCLLCPLYPLLVEVIDYITKWWQIIISCLHDIYPSMARFKVQFGETRSN